MQRTNQQNKELHMRLNHLGIDREGKESMIDNATAGRTSSSKELTQSECEDILKFLRQKDESRKNQMRRKLIHQAHLLGWKQQDGKVDMKRINNWCKHYGMYHKPLNQHTYKELIAIVSQFEKLFESYLNKTRKKEVS